MRDRHLPLAAIASLGLLLTCDPSAERSRNSCEGHVTLPSIQGADRLELRGEGGRILLLGPGEPRDLGPSSSLRSIRSPLRLRLSGAIKTPHALSIEAPELWISSTIRAHSLNLRAEGLIALEPMGSLAQAPGEELHLEADYLSLAGPIDAPGAQLRIRARAFLHQGAVSLDARGSVPAGSAEIECDRYVASINGILRARDAEGQGGTIRLLARTSLFSSGRLDVSGREGGSAWLSGRDTRLVCAELDVGGINRAGELEIGTRPAGPPGPVQWHAETILSTRGTQLRAESTSGDAGRVVVGASRSTHFEGRVLASSLIGRGGQVEISSSGNLLHGGEVQAQGPLRPGTLLLDPQNLENQRRNWGPSPARARRPQPQRNQLRPPRDRTLWRERGRH